MIFVFVLLYIGACLKWGAWRRWKEFYPSILYAVIGDLSYNFVFHDYSLWRYSGFLNHTTTDLLIAFFVFPCVVILFLTHWPQGRFKQAVYILAWSGANTLIEAVSRMLGQFTYEHGWNVFYSFCCFNTAFILIKLHSRHPLIVWPVSAALAALTMLVFGLPFETIK